MKYIIDRIEEKIAILEAENGRMFNVDKELLPECAEGDTVNISIEKNENKDINSLFKSLMKD